MRIAFFGASALGYSCCEDLVLSGFDVCGIVTMPERFEISYSKTTVRNVTYRDFGELARRHDVPLLQISRGLTAAERDVVASWTPDLGLAVGWYYMLPAEVRATFPRGLVGIHASLLPRYRGGAPLVWALINGEQETGVTLFYLDDGVDSGDVIAQRAFSIEPYDTIATLMKQAEEASVMILRDAIPRLADGTAPRTVQDESNATIFPQRSPDDGRIEWSDSAEAIGRFIRAQTHPYPGAWTVIGGKRVTIWDATVDDTVRASVGSDPLR